MKTNFFRILKIFLFFMVDLASAGSVRYSPPENSINCVKNIGIYGPIKLGDSIDFEKIVRKARLPECERYFTNFVTLDSNGGSVSESLKMGRILRSNELHTFVQKDGGCYSSCVFIFISGVTRWVRPRQLAIHRPHFENLDPNMPFAEVKKRLSRSNEEIVNFLVEMEVSTKLYDQMMMVDPTALRYLDLSDLDELRITTWAPSYDEKRTAELAYMYGMTSGEYRFLTNTASKICLKDESYDKRTHMFMSFPSQVCHTSVILGVNRAEAERKVLQAASCYAKNSEIKVIKDCQRQVYIGKN